MLEGSHRHKKLHKEQHTTGERSQSRAAAGLHTGSGLHEGGHGGCTGAGASHGCNGIREKGLLARNAIAHIPTKEEIQVAMKTPFQRGVPVLKLVSRLGFRAMIYAIVIKVVRPAMISVRTVVPFSFR